ncbi:MAG: lysophospholipid acyltransferase family protein [Gemmatimonadota bacterium]
MIQTLKFGVVGVLGSLLIRALMTTCRIRVESHPDFERYRQEGGRVIFVFWHRYILPLAFQHRGEGASVLVSQHRDGEYIARVMAWLGFRTARGSSTRGGSSGLRGLVRDARAGVDLAVTPDGPRGPRYEVKEGVVTLARLTERPMVPISVSASRAWVLSSWDAFVVPQPFATLQIRYGAPRYVQRQGGKGALEEARLSVERTLMEWESLE